VLKKNVTLTAAIVVRLVIYFRLEKGEETLSLIRIPIPAHKRMKTDNQNIVSPFGHSFPIMPAHRLKYDTMNPMNGIRSVIARKKTTVTHNFR
jgi:hypothetical protein